MLKNCYECGGGLRFKVQSSELGSGSVFKLVLGSEFRVQGWRGHKKLHSISKMPLFALRKFQNALANPEP